MTTNTTQIEHRHVEQARELILEEYARRGAHSTAADIRAGFYDTFPEHVVLARLLRERPVYTREQELEAMAEAVHDCSKWACIPAHERLLNAYKANLARIMAPKPPVDPLVEVLSDLEWTNPEQLAPDLRQALAMLPDRGAPFSVLIRLLAEHEASQPTREQELEAMGEALQLSATPGGVIDAYKSALARIMAPKPVDPEESARERGRSMLRQALLNGHATDEAFDLALDEYVSRLKDTSDG